MRFDITLPPLIFLLFHFLHCYAITDDTPFRFAPLRHMMMPASYQQRLFSWLTPFSAITLAPRHHYATLLLSYVSLRCHDIFATIHADTIITILRQICAIAFSAASRHVTFCHFTVFAASLLLLLHYADI